MKYNPGDMVRIRNDLKYGRKYGTHYFTKNLISYMGKEFKIAKQCLPDVPDVCYYILEGLEDEHAYFTDEMLEPVIKRGIKAKTKKKITKRTKMYTLRFHFVGGGHYDEIITPPDYNKTRCIEIAGLIMHQDYTETESGVINLHNVTMIEIIEQED